MLSHWWLELALVVVPALSAVATQANAEHPHPYRSWNKVSTERNVPGADRRVPIPQQDSVTAPY